MARIEFWLSYNNGAERLRLPVNPPSIQVDSPFGFEDIEVSQLGEISVAKERGLKSVSFSSFFPKYYNSSYCEYVDIPNPETAVETIERWRDSRNPIRLTITGANINMACTIRDFTITKEEAGKPQDISFDISLKEFRFVTFNRIEIPKDDVVVTLPVVPPAQQRPSNKTPNRTYTVKKGDSLWAISKRTLGSGSKWRKIYEANKAKIGKNPNLIYPGQVLVIPND